MDVTAVGSRERARAAPSAEVVWRALAKESFAVVAHVTPDGAPRSSGVSYGVIDGALCVVVGWDSWKARHMAADGRVAVTVPVHRGGVLALVLPIPPATISFHGTVVVHGLDTERGRVLLDRLGSVLPPEERAGCVVLEITPRRQFLTYGIGVSLTGMRDPAVARARVPLATT